MSQISQQERQELASRGFKNPAWFCRFFLEKWFPQTMPWVHYGIIAILTRRTDFLLDFGFTVNGLQEKYNEAWLEKIIKNFVWKADPNDPDCPEQPVFIAKRDENGKVLSVDLVVGKYTLIMMPRGFSKTTLLNAINIWFSVYQECKFPVYISKTGRHASKQLSSITKQLTTNALLLEIFGNLKPPQRNEEGFKWSESDGFIQMSNGISVMAVGTGGQIRGSLTDAQRPDRLNIDDIEDTENTKTDERRKDTRQWFFSDVLPSLPELDPKATATMLCNLVHSDSLGTHLMVDPSWTVIKFGPLDRDGDPLWPELMDEEKLEAKKQSYALQGELATFYLEYFNEIRHFEESKFHPNFFIYIPILPSDLVRKAIVLDPAISEDPKSDYASIAVVGIKRTGGIHICDTWGRVQASPADQLDMYFELLRKWQMTYADRFGVETIAFQASLVQPMQERMFREKFYFEITRITHGNTAKIPRVEGVLQPRYANGFITHQRKFPELETQLLDWPKGKKDFPDAAAMALSLLGEDVMLIPGLASGKKLSDDQYKSLEDEFAGDWRQY